VHEPPFLRIACGGHQTPTFHLISNFSQIFNSVIPSPFNFQSVTSEGTSIDSRVLGIVILSLQSATPMGPTVLETLVFAAGDNKTALYSQRAPGWATTSNIRSTWDLVRSALLTLLIFSYSAVHINLPQPNWNLFARINQKISVTLLAALAPEFILAMALGQFVTAKRLSKRLRQLWKEAESVGSLGAVMQDVCAKYVL
jgi:hypothetical protein